MTKTTYSELDWYDTPRWYDLVFDADTPREADFLEQVAREHGRVRGASAHRVLEPACGSGRLVLELARRGWSVAGFDLNANMLDYARARLARARQRAQLTLGDMSAFRVRGTFGLAHCLVSTFKYLLTERAAENHLHCVARALARGGVYVLGFHLTDYASRSTSRERWTAAKAGASVVCNTQVWPADRRARLEAVRTRLVVRRGAREQRSETRWSFRTYDVRQVRALLARVPELEHVATYDFTHSIDTPRELDGELLDVVLVLRKR
jgi:SAM-dependent methyltransferase